MTEDRDTNLPEPGQVFAGYYEIIELAGVGGYAKVFRARALHLETEVAVKILDSDLKGSARDAFLQRFYREALLTSVLSHPNTVTPIDYGRTDDGSAYIVMEFLDGESVADVIDDGGRFDIERTRQIIGDVLESLAEAHDRGIVHSDIKSSNIFLQTGNPQARVLDFGVASLIDDNDTDISQVFGTPHYIAPEAAVGNPITEAADIYSLGITAYEMVYRKLPFDAENSQDILKAHVLKPLPQLSEELLADPLSDFVQQATAKSPSIRPTARQSLELLHPDSKKPGSGSYHTPAGGMEVTEQPEPPRHGRSLRMRTDSETLKREQSRVLKRGHTSYKLRETLHSYFNNDGGVIYLTGPRGVGKDRLMRQLVADPSFSVNDENVLYMDASTCRTGSGRTDIAMLLEQIPRRFPGMGRLATPAEELAREIRRNYDDPALLNRFVDLLFTVGSRHPFVWVFSSVERADPQVARFLSLIFDRFSRNAHPDSSLALVIEVSTDEPINCRPISYILRNIAHGVWPRITQIEVPPISDQQMRKLVESIEPMAENVVDMLVDLSEGNPGKMMWLLRTGKKRRLLRSEHGRLVMRLRADFGRLRNEADQNKELRERIRHALEEEGMTFSVIALSFLGPEFTETVGNALHDALDEYVDVTMEEALTAAVDRNVVAVREGAGDQEKTYSFHHHSAVHALQSLLSQKELDAITIEAAGVLEAQKASIDACIRAARLYSRAGVHDRAAKTAAAGARIAFDDRNYEQGLDLYTLAYSELQTSDEDFSVEFQCEIETHLGRCRMETGAIGAAEEILKSACERAQEASLERFELECHLLLAEIGVIRGDSDAVGTRARRMLKLARSFDDDPRYYVRALLLVGKYSRNSGKKKKAAKFFVQAEKLAEKHDFPLLRADARMGISRLFAEDERYDRAEQLMSEAIRYFRNANIYSRLIEALVELGNVRLNSGKSAESLFRDAERLAEEQGHGRMLADILAGQGRAMANHGELDSASILLLRAIERYRQLGNIRGEAHALLALARTSLRRNQIEAARTYAAESIETHKKARDASGYDASLLVAADVALKRQDADEAIKFAEEAVSRLSESRRDSTDLMRAMLLLGQSYMRARNMARAHGTLARALALAESRGDREIAAEIRSVLVRASR
jgi:serine/threonine protein kinase/tetratricopeptide (TPR) repeat protein